MVSLICSNNICGSYDRAGIKNMCGKCFMESHKEDFQRFFKHENEKYPKSEEFHETHTLEGHKQNSPKSYKHEDKECPKSEEIESQVSDEFNVCATLATITLNDSTNMKMDSK
ncbi:unnamed protein product [Lathyrus sativus]|nr:unnamed protein product [Lathyrus sativus]CAK8056034.1 unnamed protein product [Lathyrus sativus]